MILETMNIKGYHKMSDNKGIWMPIEVLHDDNLTMQEKFVLMEITQLTMLDKGCVASNKHFAELLKTSTKSISNTISKLVKKGYIKTVIKKGSRNQIREIFTIHRGMEGYPQKVEGVSIKSGESKENKTINKTINKEKIQKENPNLNTEACNEWLEYKKYKSKAPITKTINFLSQYPKQLQQEIVNTSIMNGYKGLFPPKQQKEIIPSSYADIDLSQYGYKS